MKPRLIFLTVLFICLLSLVGCVTTDPQKPPPPTKEIMIIGHRGAAGLLPENSIAGFMKAIEIGVDAFELDVHLTSDNVVVVTHDYKLKPEITRDSTGKWIKKKPLIKDLNLAQIQSFDIGRLNRSTDYAKKYPNQKNVDGERIPTLLDVIKLVKRSDDNVKIFIELKTSPGKTTESNSLELIAREVAKIIKEENFIDRVTVISFDWRGLSHIKKYIPGVRTAHLTIANKSFDTIQSNKDGPSPWMNGVDIDEFKSIPEAIKAAGGGIWATNYYHTLSHGKSINSDIVEQAHTHGLYVLVWTVNNRQDMKRMIKMNVDGIITDRPDILKDVLNR